MNFDAKDLEALAAAMISKGAPILGGIIGGPFGAIIGALVPQIAVALGLPEDAAPAQVAQTVVASPDAADKLSAIEEDHKNALAVLQLQVGQNTDELNAGGSAPAKFFYGGWRPAMGWISGPVLLTYVLILFAVGRTPLPTDVLGLFISVWLALAGVRSFERWQGIAVDNIPARLKK